MVRSWSRRQVLSAGVSVGTATLAGCTVSGDAAAPVDVRGAMYLPARAFNTFQMWHTYEPEVTERDLGNATRLGLNAVRTWLSYEAWEKDPSGLRRSVEHFLDTAAENDIRVLLGIFEGVGRPPTPQNLHDTDPWTATSVFSPGMLVMKNPGRWGKPRKFVRWVMDRYRDDDRLLGIELMNEPGWRPWKKRFAREMFRVLAAERGRVPLSVGATSLANVADYYDWGVDAIQLHYNFPQTLEKFRGVLRQAIELRESSGMSVWLSEWQRLADFGWGDESVSTLQRGPKYASLAPLIRKAGVDNFFWSLMLKPAYMVGQRRRGILNGVFHEDGAVWSREDAKAIKSMSGDSTFQGRQRREWPEWASSVRERV